MKNPNNALFKKGELVRIKRVDEMATVIADRGKRVLVKMAGKYDDFVCWMARDEVEEAQFKNTRPDPKVLRYLQEEISKLEDPARTYH
jgi:hypothetical protein